ncbi:EAL domain-containing protein [Clostridium folliculivorans]|uniref:EAL domain-containing protein n=1 Tax=Clostridium folliculivorans TaxID=2886038 RepID=UPI0021C34F70|nr:EAL domain-containing protein [Clostridium folliculivorans]
MSAKKEGGRGVFYNKNFKKKKIFNIFITSFVSFMLVGFLIPFINPPVTNAEQQEKNILLINSYDSTYTWTIEQTEGILRKFKETEPKSKVYVEYIDWKNSPYKENLDKVEKLIKSRYQNKKIDLIMTTDDAALDFSVKNRQEIFGNIPIVFSGVFNEAAKRMTEGYSNVYGVFEDDDISGTVKSSIFIYPNTKKLYVVHDNTETGIASFKEVKEELNELNSKIDLQEINNLSVDNLEKNIPAIDKDSIVLVTTYARDNEGKTVQNEELTNFLSNKLSVPIFGIYKMDLNHGIIGGSLLSGEEHGASAAELAINIMNGVLPDKSLSDNKKAIVGIYDNNVMKKFNISKDQLPKDSVIVNEDFSFYKTYKHLVWGVISVILILTALVTILIINILRRKKAEDDLKKNNYELSELYEELAVSDEELRHQYIKLEENRDTIQKNEEMYKLVFETANDGLWEINLTTGERYFSDRWYEIFDLSREELKDMDEWFKILHPEDCFTARNLINDVSEGIRDTFSFDFRIRKKDGEYKWIHGIGKSMKDNYGRPFKIVGSHSDIHEKKLQEEQIKRLAFFDSLTGLPNRTEISRGFDELIKEDKERNIAVIFMDLDNFKNINDSFGHTIGDDLLIEVSKRIKSVTGDKGIVSRHGGDEFLIILPNAIDKEFINSYIDDLAKRLGNNISVNGVNVITSASFGAAIYPKDGHDFEELLKNADTAMYKSKEAGKRTFTFFERWMNDNILEMLIMENQLRLALNKDEFVLHFQPKISLKDSRIEGFEALIRWNSETLGFVSPFRFITLAEKTGIIIQIGKWVLEQSCEFITKIHNLGYKDINISLNVSVVQLLQDDFLNMVEGIIAKSSVDSKFINLEITESILMESIDKNITKLNKLKEKSIKISLDDFGKGYSSLTYLKDMPFDTLKIDKVFIDELCSEDANKTNESIVGVIIQLAHQMGLNVVAEGVETEEQYNYLVDNKCDIVQGYYISKPIPEEQALELLKKYNS